MATSKKKQKKPTRKAQPKALTIEQHNVLCLERREKLYHKTVVAEIAAYERWFKYAVQRHEAFALLLEARENVKKDAVGPDSGRQHRATGIVPCVINDPIDGPWEPELLLVGHENR